MIRPSNGLRPSIGSIGFVDVIGLVPYRPFC
jgi:hypothetical protein